MDLKTGRIRVPTGALVRLASRPGRAIEGLTSGDHVGRELNSPYYVNVMHDPTMPLPSSGFAGANVFRHLDMQTRPIKSGENEFSLEQNPITNAIARSKLAAEAVTAGRQGPVSIPRSSYIWNGVIGRSESDKGSYSTWMEGSALQQGYDSRLELGDTSVALIKARHKDQLESISRHLCYKMGYPIDLYLRRAAPVQIAVGTRHRWVYPTLIFRGGVDSFGNDVTVGNNEFAGFGREQSIPIWTGQDESFSLSFKLWCTNRAELVNNRDQLAWMHDLLRPTYSDGELSTPGGWAYLRVGSMGLHDGEEGEMLVFVNSLSVTIGEGSTWESTRVAEGLNSFQHPLLIDVTIGGRRILKHEKGLAPSRGA